MAAPTLQHLMACKRVLRYLKELEDMDETNWIHRYKVGMWFGWQKIHWSLLRILGKQFNTWSSKKQSMVARSSAESEYRALAELTWLQSLFSEIGIQCTLVPSIWCDNASATELSKNPIYHSRTKHIELDMHIVRGKILVKELEISYITCAEQIAQLYLYILILLV